MKRHNDNRMELTFIGENKLDRETVLKIMEKRLKKEIISDTIFGIFFLAMLAVGWWYSFLR